MDRERQKQIRSWKKKNPGPTELQKINSSKAGIQERIRDLLKKGATKLSKPKSTDFDNFAVKGHLISYINKLGKYRSGGFITSWTDDYFTVLGGGGFGPRISFCVQFKDVVDCYIRKVNRDGPLKPKAYEGAATNFPISIDGIVVYYARSRSDQKRFIGTKKYQRMMKWSVTRGKIARAERKVKKALQKLPVTRSKKRLGMIKSK